MLGTEKETPAESISSPAKTVQQAPAAEAYIAQVRFSGYGNRQQEAELQMSLGKVQNALATEKDPDKGIEVIDQEVGRALDEITAGSQQMSNMKAAVVETLKEFAKNNPEETAALLGSLQTVQANPDNTKAQKEIANNMIKLVEENPKAAVNMAIEAGKANQKSTFQADMVDAIKNIPIIGAFIEAILEKVVEHMVKDAGPELRDAQKNLGWQMSGGENVEPNSQKTPSQTPKGQAMTRNVGVDLG